MSEIKKNSEVILKSFSGTLTSKTKESDSENYWKLIGQEGKVINDKELDDGRVLILFKNSLDDFKVINQIGRAHV